MKYITLEGSFNLDNVQKKADLQTPQYSTESGAFDLAGEGKNFTLNTNPLSTRGWGAQLDWQTLPNLSLFLPEGKWQITAAPEVKVTASLPSGVSLD